MNKRLNLFLLFCTVIVMAHAQWSRKDSLDLRRVLEGDGEIKLNPNAVKQIDFGSFIGTPMMSTDKPALQYDVNLPAILPEKRKVKLTLLPYSARTKFNYDPIYDKKIKVGPDTWRGDSIPQAIFLLRYSNWAKHPLDGGERKSLEEIEATGLRYNLFAERANGMAVGAWQPVRYAPTGNDYMKPFTRGFWDKAGRKRREKTLELLKNYGDSTTTTYNEEIKEVLIR